MKALVFNGPKDIRYESFNDPVIRDERNLVVRVINCSICGSDLHMYHGERIGTHDYSQPMQHFCTGHEAIGVGPTLTQAVRMARVGGRLSVLGILQADTSMPLHIVQGKSLVVHMGIAGIVGSWPELIPLLQAGRIKGEGVFTHHFDLCEGAEAYRMFEAQEDGVMKVLITP